MEIAPRPRPKTDDEIDAGMRSRIRNLSRVGALGLGAMVAATGYQATHTEPTPASERVEAATTTTLAPETTTTTEQQTTPANWLPEGVKAKWPLIVEVAKGYQIDPQLVAIIIAEESGGNEHAVNPSGAKGLFQLMPDTEKVMASKLGYTNYNIYDSKTNLELGTALIRYLNDHYIAPAGVDLETPQGIAMLAYGMSGGEGDLQTFIRTGSLNSTSYAKQNQAVANLWVNMWSDRGEPTSPTFEQLRGVQK